MALNRLTGRCEHFWEARHYATPIAPNDHRRALNTLRYIHANPKADGMRRGFMTLFQLRKLRQVGQQWYWRMAPQLPATGINPEEILQA